jgi:hypothetical protein
LLILSSSFGKIKVKIGANRVDPSPDLAAPGRPRLFAVPAAAAGPLPAAAVLPAAAPDLLAPDLPRPAASIPIGCLARARPDIGPGLSGGERSFV